ncbi:MAG TPA: ABC transporter ATP-binding protein [Nitrospiria bacterium]|nr:ABC transporter ATP-binding protein [Nitrospiria bacterium]
MLKLSEVRAGYGPIEALKGISLEVNAGEIVALIGANGAGKSTTLMTISGMIKPGSGSISFQGEEIGGLPPHRIVEKGICQVPEGRRIFPRLTVLENLEVGAFPRRNRSAIAREIDGLFDQFPILRERKNQQGGTLSGGEQQMLAIARALVSRPRLLLLDEPSLGLSPVMATTIFELIRRINRGEGSPDGGITILLVEQNARAALQLANRGYVMETGQIALTQEARLLLEDPRVRSVYLGEAV